MLSSTTQEESQDCSDIVDSDKNKNSNNIDNNDIDDMTTESLLESVPISQFVELCLHLNLPAEGTKEDMLQRLRKHAEEQASLDRQRKLARAERVQQGFYANAGTDAAGEEAYYKERYEVIDGDDDVDNDQEESDSMDDEGFFYFVAPTRDADTKENVTTAESKNTTTTTTANTEVNVQGSTKGTKTKKDNPTTTRQRITAPPPPKTTNEQGERVVTVYSTSDTNDLTSYSRPGSTDNGGGGSGVLMEGEGQEPPAPWDFNTQQQQQQAPKLSIELEEAKETVMELVRSLLLLSGAPAFVLEFTEGLQPLENTRLPSAPQPSREFVGFDPSLVPIDILIASSKTLRAGGRRSGTSSVLHDVLHELELRAIGYDGMAGDDKSKGGGHYQQVNKIRAFLEGFRRAELRRIARETTTLLLDKLASEGIQGLDTMLSTMTKSQDDSGDAGQLNDALLDFLNDMVREQSARVGDVSRVDRTIPERNDSNDGEDANDDELSKLWNVTSENGERIETLDPNDPVVKETMVKEWNRGKDITKQGLQQQQPQPQLPTGAPEQLLLLLKMLRDRIKAEAAFGGDKDRGRNLRILAYCLRFTRAFDREKLLRREFQSSVDRLDTFLELVVSSIEYAESASTQLKPASSSGILNLQLLKEIMSLGRRIREEMATSRS
ncbi:hypothetical protein MHU86_12190 [Fragilaria crotonensis]|nr:hypothetical protein MHU86_12190 [Fragilaria crotonensis]